MTMPGDRVLALLAQVVGHDLMESLLAPTIARSRPSDLSCLFAEGYLPLAAVVPDAQNVVLVHATPKYKGL